MSRSKIAPVELENSMPRRAVLIALLLLFTYVTVSDAQLFRRRRAARQDSVETMRNSQRRDLERQQRDLDRAAEKQQKELEKLQRERIRQAQKNAPKQPPLTYANPQSASAPVFTRPRAASAADLNRAQNQPGSAINNRPAQQSDDRLYYLDRQGRAQATNNPASDPSRQYYRRASTINRGNQAYLVLNPVSRAEIEKIINSRMVAQPSTLPRSPAVDAAKTAVSPAGFGDPIINAPRANPEASILKKDETPESPKNASAIPTTTKDDAKPKKGVMRSVLETVDENKSEGPVIKPPKKGSGAP